MYPNAPEVYQKSSPQPQDIPTQAPPSAYPPQPQATPTQAPPSAYPPQPQAIPTQAPPSAYPPQPIPFHHHDGIPTLGQWSSGLCDCFDDPTNCFITCCCPCVTFGQIAEIVDKGTTSCAQAGAIYYLLASVGCACIYTCTYRSKLRGLYSLREDPCTDFLVHCCCDACALCQEYRELKKWGMDPSIGWQANAMRQGQSTVPPTVASGMTR